MIINYLTDYLPDNIISNGFFIGKMGLSNEEIISKSGIKQRRHTSFDENTNTMAIEAVKKAYKMLPFSINKLDLIIGASYTPFDTIGTIAHAVQREFNIANAKCFTIDSACSSFVNAIEIADSFFTSNKVKNALIVVSENNSTYYDGYDPKSCFLWGDGAAAVFVSNQRYSDNDIEVVDINSSGLGHIGKSTDAVYLRPSDGGLKMPFGNDVFQYACTYMINETQQILYKNNLAIRDLNYFIPHQANARITEYIVKKLKIDKSKVLSNIELYGNTGSASTPIVLSQNIEKFKQNDSILISVFGGGYSSGAILLKKL